MTDELSRRAALKVLGTVPLAHALGGFAWPATVAPQVPAQQAPKQTHEGPTQPAQGRGTPASSRPKQHFFTVGEYRTVHVLADDIIPRDSRSPSATEAGVPAFIDYHLSVPETSEDTRTAMRGGLRWLDTECRRRVRLRYSAATRAQRHALLDDIAWPGRARPELSAGVAFFSRFRDMVGSGFFSSAHGWRDLQYQGNVFNPDWRGCPEAAMRKLGVDQSLMATRIPPQ